MPSGPIVDIYCSHVGSVPSSNVTVRVIPPWPLLTEFIYIMLSTPFIWLSSGGGYDLCNDLWSSSGILALTVTCGGTSSGNCATGSVIIDTRPSRIITIEHTVANIGLLMKIAENISLSLSFWHCRPRFYPPRPLCVPVFLIF